MAHPFQDKRSDKVQKARVSHIAGKAAGGSSHSDEAADRSLVKRMVKPAALRADGGAVKARADRPGRARGGAVKKSKGTTVNVIVGPAGGVEARPQPSQAPAAPPPAPPMPPMRPPGMAPSAALPPPGASPMPPMMRARGGKVSDASSGATKVQHSDPMEGQRKNIGRKPVITKKRGGAISSEKGKMGPKLSGGALGARARLEKPSKAVIK